MERERQGEEGREREVRREHNITDMTHDLESSSLNSKKHRESMHHRTGSL